MKSPPRRSRTFVTITALVAWLATSFVAPPPASADDVADLGVAVSTEQAGPTIYASHDAVAGTDQVVHMTVHNYGPSGNSAFTATLNVPALDTAGDMTYVGAKVGATNASNCTADTSAHTVTCTDAAGLALDASRTYDITLHIAPNFTDPTNTPNNRKSTTYSAALSGLTPTDQGANDQGPDSDPATGSTTLNVDAVADLAIDKTAASNPVVAGTNEVYTLTVTNNGPSINAGYTVTDQIPDQTTYVSATAQNSPLASCGTPQGPSNTVTCTSPGLAKGASETFTLTVKVASSYPDGGTLSNTGTIATLRTNDPHVNDNTDTVNVKVTDVAVKRQADLGIAVTTAQAGPTTYTGHDAVAGTDQVFHMTVHNYGPSDNSAFTATLNVPALDTAGDMTYVGAKVGATNASNCTADTSAHTVTCTDAAGLAFDASRTYDITLHIAPNFTDPNSTKSTTYSAALSGLTPTDQGANDQGPDSDPASPGSTTLNVDAVADVRVKQTATEEAANGFTGASGFDALSPGNRNTVLYEVTVSNGPPANPPDPYKGGPSAATGVTLTENLPSTHYQTGSITFCIVTNIVPCTNASDYSSYTNTTQPVPLGTIALNGSKVVRFRVPLKTGDRRGALTSFMAGAATATAATTSTDSSSGNNSGSVDINLYTVPDAPTLQEVQPGNKQIAVRWQDGANGGDAITGYDIIANGTAYFVPIANTTLVSGKRSTIFPVPGTLTNGTTYTIRIEARNGAGDSDPSTTSLQATPCSSCVISQLSTSTQTTTLLSSNNTSQVITGTNTKCFPWSNLTSKPGATTADPKVSCFQVPSGLDSKVGSLIALHDEAPNTAYGGDCPDPAHPCLGNQVSVAIPPGTGTSVQFFETIIYDRTISTQKYGEPCTTTSCGGKYTYDVYMRRSINESAVKIGSTIKSSWCTKNTQTGLYNIPTGSPGCVIEYLAVNSSVNPSDNGNTSNGKEGNGDLRLTVVFWGDPRTAP